MAFLLEPDLKTGRGGLRDAHAIRWAQLAGVELLAADTERLDEAYQTLLRSPGGLAPDHRSAQRCALRR